MVSSPRVEGGTVISARVRKTIQSIREIVGNHSEVDIYTTLKETGMDPNEAAQKLLSQEPFHEVRRRRDKKKESMGYKGSAEPRKLAERVGGGMKFRTYSDYKGSAEPRKYAERVGQEMKSQTHSDHNVQGGGYNRNNLPGIIREFRVVRDNRVNQNAGGESKASLRQTSRPANDHGVSNVKEKGSTGVLSHQRPSSGRGVRGVSQAPNGPNDSKGRHPRDANLIGMDKKEFSERQVGISNVASRVQAVKSNYSQPHSVTMSSNNSVLGVYSSSSDPVHVPSPDSRSSAAVGAIKREVGVVGNRRQPSVPSSSVSNSLLSRDLPSPMEPYQPFVVISKNDQINQSTVPEPVISSVSVGRSVLSSQSSTRSHQQQRAAQPSKEWKPKSSKKSNSGSPGVIGVPAKSVSPADRSKDVKTDAAQLQDDLLQINISENQNVIIAQHIRVADTDRCLLTFGSFEAEADSSKDMASGFLVVGGEEESSEAAASLSVSAPESSLDDATGTKQVDVLGDHVRHSGPDSPESGTACEPQLADNGESLSSQNMENYAGIGMVRENSPSYTPSDSQQRQDPAELPSFSAYDPQTGYDISYFRGTTNEPARGQDLPSPQESLSSHTVNSIPTSTIAMVQQQPPPVAQMYPQVHMSHFANLMPYRQFLSPVYVPPMAMPGYSNNATYPHPSNGSSYLLMPGGNSHLSANGLKYGIQQFKPVPAGSPTGFANFTNPAGYAINAPGVVGNASGLEDSSRLKYKDGNIYVPNPQAETSEIWVQNPRDLPSLQSAPYYNMQGQTPHAAYIPSHTGHPTYNAAAAQSSNMQFPGVYHPHPQPAAIVSPHHLGPPTMGGNVGVGVAAAAAPGAQVGAYQQPQLSHLNWTTNF